MSTTDIIPAARLDQVTKARNEDSQNTVRGEIKTPNKDTLAAMAELEAGKGKSFGTIEDLMADLNAED